MTKDIINIVLGLIIAVIGSLTLWGVLVDPDLTLNEIKGLILLLTAIVIFKK